MKTSKSNTENQNEPKKTTLDDLLKKGRSDRKDDTPAEEFITPDPTRSVPEKKSGVEEIDKMGISEKAKRQSRDVSENK